MLGIVGYDWHICSAICIYAGLSLGILTMLVLHRLQKKVFWPAFYFTFPVLFTGFFIGQSLALRTDVRQFDRHYTHFIKAKTSNFIQLKIVNQLKSTPYFRQYTGQMLTLNKQKVIGNVLIKMPKTNQGLKVGDRLDILVDSLQIKNFETVKNPDGFDYKKFMARNKLFHQINLTNVAYKIIRKTGSDIFNTGANFREYFIANLTRQNWSQSVKGLAIALLLGQRQDLSPDIYQYFQATGTVHILAISGLHIGILLIFLNFIFKPVKYKSKVVFLLLTIGFLWFYAMLTGFSPSVLRAVIMFSFLQLGLQSKRALNIYNSLFLAALVMLIINPDFLYQLGFQMSFMAVLSIVSFYPLLSSLTPVSHKFLKWWVDLFWVSVAAQIGVLPLTLFYFHQFPKYFFIANLLTVPLLFVILITGFLLMILSLTHLDIEFLYKFLGFLIQVLIDINRWIAGWPHSLIQDIFFSKPMLLMSIAGGLLLYLLLKRPRTFKYWRWFGVWIISFELLLLYQEYNRQHIRQYIIYKQYKVPVVAEANGNNLVVYQDSSLVNNYLLKSFNRHYSHITFDSLSFYKRFKNWQILHVDSLGVYQFKHFQPDIVVLQSSPKINLDRLILYLKPKLIVVDGSNYPSYIRRWQHSANQYHTTFYNVNDQGAFILKANKIDD